MEEILKSIIEYENNLIESAFKNKEEEEMIGINPKLIHLVGLSQDQLSQVCSFFFSTYQGTSIGKKLFLEMFKPILKIDESDFEYIMSGITVIFFGNKEEIDAYEILCFIIMFSNLDVSLKVEDLFDVFDVFQNKIIEEGEFIVTIFSLLIGLQKVYSHAIKFEAITDDDFLNSLSLPDDPFPWCHDTFVSYFVNTKYVNLYYYS